MKVLLLESGGREHALAHAIAASKQPSELVIAPRSPSTAALGHNVALNPSDPEAVLTLSQEIIADLVVIDPETPLIAGVTDTLRTVGFAVFGPSHTAAQLEGSETFTKEVMTAVGVPAAADVAYSTLAEVYVMLQRLGAPYVAKQGGLAVGRDVVVTEDLATALQHAAACTNAASLSANRESGVMPTPEVASHETGSTAGTVPTTSPAAVIKEYLDGPEASVFCLCDGEDVMTLPPAQNYKRACDEGERPNTGGMGTYSPLPRTSPDLGQRTIEGIARSILVEMTRHGTPSVGLLYVGLTLTSRRLRVVELNVCFGDPEAQSVLERAESDLLAYPWAAATSSLGAMSELRVSAEAVVNVVLATPGYPETPQVGGVITGLDAGYGMPGAHVTHAETRLAPHEPGASGANGVSGTGEVSEASGVTASTAGRMEPSKASGANQTVARKPAAAVPGADRRPLTSGGTLVSSGGRMLSVVMRGSDSETARERAYVLMAKIHLEGGYFRHDIAAL